MAGAELKERRVRKVRKTSGRVRYRFRMIPQYLSVPGAEATATKQQYEFRWSAAKMLGKRPRRAIMLASRRPVPQLI